MTQDDLPMVPTAVLSPDGAEAAGYARFNDGPHLAVDVPDGNITITARLTNGKRVTFAFIPYRKDEPAGCVNISCDDTHHQIDLDHLNVGGGGSVVGAELVANRRSDGSTTYDVVPQHKGMDSMEPNQAPPMRRSIGDRFTAITDEHGVTSLWERDRLVRIFREQVTDGELRLFVDGLIAGQQDGETEVSRGARRDMRGTLGR